MCKVLHIVPSTPVHLFCITLLLMFARGKVSWRFLFTETESYSSGNTAVDSDACCGSEQQFVVSVRDVAMEQHPQINRCTGTYSYLSVSLTPAVTDSSEAPGPDSFLLGIASGECSSGAHAHTTRHPSTPFLGYPTSPPSSLRPLTPRSSPSILRGDDACVAV